LRSQRPPPLLFNPRRPRTSRLGGYSRWRANIWVVLKEVIVIAAVALRATIFTAKPEWKLGTIVRNLGCVHNYHIGGLVLGSKKRNWPD